MNWSTRNIEWVSWSPKLSPDLKPQPSTFSVFVILQFCHCFAPKCECILFQSSNNQSQQITIRNQSILCIWHGDALPSVGTKSWMIGRLQPFSDRWISLNVYDISLQICICPYTWKMIQSHQVHRVQTLELDVTDYVSINPMGSII